MDDGLTQSRSPKKLPNVLYKHPNLRAFRVFFVYQILYITYLTKAVFVQVGSIITCCFAINPVLISDGNTDSQILDDASNCHKNHGRDNNRVNRRDHKRDPDNGAVEWAAICDFL